MDPSSRFMRWWERTWTEREQLLEHAFGKSHPPGSPPRYVISFAELLGIPGACAMVFPPTPGGPQAPARRDEWLYLTHGLTQPPGPREVKEARKAGDDRSGYGWELGILVAEPANWASYALRGFMAFVTEGTILEPGRRFQFGFAQDANGELLPFTGAAEQLGLVAEGEIGAMLFWPYLLPRGPFVSGTGSFGILIATAITVDEWKMAKESSSAHVQLLLCKAGVGQRSDPHRQSVTHDLYATSEWERIRTLALEQTLEELKVFGPTSLK